MDTGHGFFIAFCLLILLTTLPCFATALSLLGLYHCAVQLNLGKSCQLAAYFIVGMFVSSLRL